MLPRTILIVLCVVSAFPSAIEAKGKPSQTVAKMVASKLPALGHRNWIVVADSAYPLQTSPGIETITTRESLISCVKQVLSALSKTKHVRPSIFLDSELNFVSEEYAPGITAFRKSLNQTLLGKRFQLLLHEAIIAKLDEAGKTFKVLLIKTPHTMPYTSVFFQLECGYWSDEAERKLREAMKGSSR